jgi:hypothetical protein
MIDQILRSAGIAFELVQTKYAGLSAGTTGSSHPNVAISAFKPSG